MLELAKDSDFDAARLGRHLALLAILLDISEKFGIMEKI